MAANGWRLQAGATPAADRWFMPVVATRRGITMRLKAAGLVSAWHAVTSEADGAESRPTLFFLWNEARPFHIDYVFAPAGWVEAATVGSYADWVATRLSDHVPVTVDLTVPRSA